MPLDDSTRCRCLRITWNQSKFYLPKYSSLPELQLAAKERNCRQCGLTNPLCLWCTWSCKEANHEPKSSIPRARRTSAPPRVFIRIDLSPSSGKFTLLADNHTNIHSVATSHQTKMNVMSSQHSIINPPATASHISPSMPIHQNVVDVPADVYHRCIVDIDLNMVNDSRELYPVPAFGDVATATRSPFLSFPRTVTVERVEHNLEDNNSVGTKTGFLTHTAGVLTSERILSTPLRLENVERSHSDSTIMKPNPTLKVSRGSFNLSCADKIPPFHLDDTHEHAKNVSLGHDEAVPSPPKSPKHFRPLRRKNHLNIMPSHPDSDASEPIAISLNLHHPPPPVTTSHLIKKASQILTDYISPHPHTKTHTHSRSQSQSIVASYSSDGTTDPVTPPMTPTHQRSPPNSAPPKIKSAGGTRSSSPELNPIRLGHPSRPYYNAIRKNGVSPPPARLRPQSQPPPSSFHLGFDLTPAVTPESTTVTNASRHLSMSAMFASPPAFSALSLSDEDDNGDFEVHSGPTNSARLSLSSSLHGLSFTSPTQTHLHHSHSQSLSRAKGIASNRSSGIGCSMSGETELRMALATSSPSGVATLGRTTQDGFRFRETVIESENNSNNNIDSTNVGAGYLHSRNVRSRDSFMGRVKKLRKGLTEMLMNKNTATTTT